MNRFTVNGKEYTAKAFDFNLVCDLEDMGISLEQAGTKPMSMVRAYFALCAGMSVPVAGKEMEKHVMSGGTLEDVTISMSKEMEISDFFRALNKADEAEVPAGPKEKK